MKNLFLFKSRNVEKDEEIEIPKIEVTCPSCKTKQLVSEGAISTFCKSCKKIFDIKKALEKAEEEQKNVNHHPEDDFNSDSKIITCSSCATRQNVPVIAISAFCKKCGQRINLQDYKKNDFFRGDLETKGTLYITQTGEVVGTVSVGSAIIDGKFNGKLSAEGLVKLQPGCAFFGELHAPKLEVSDGALFIGISKVKPNFTVIKDNDKNP